MTPFPTDPDRTATISLDKQEEVFVRGYQSALETPFNRVLLERIMVKLLRSLKVSDVLSGPVGHTVRERAPDIEINLDLLEL